MCNAGAMRRGKKTGVVTPSEETGKAAQPRGFVCIIVCMTTRDVSFPMYTVSLYGLCQTDRGRGEHPATYTDLRGPCRVSASPVRDNLGAVALFWKTIFAQVTEIQ